MPFVSKAQRKYMYTNVPEMAAEFEAATPKGKRLPNKVKSSKSRKTGGRGR